MTMTMTMGTHFACGLAVVAGQHTTRRDAALTLDPWRVVRDALADMWDG
jgi:hypothetical protein